MLTPGVLVTELDTREELISHINDLEEKIVSLEEEIDRLQLTSQQKERLTEAADVMADLGKIHNMPAAKQAWIEGE